MDECLFLPDPKPLPAPALPSIELQRRGRAYLARGFKPTTDAGVIEGRGDAVGLATIEEDTWNAMRWLQQPGQP